MRTEGSSVKNFPHRMPQFQLLGARATTRVSAVGESLELTFTFISIPIGLKGQGGRCIRWGFLEPQRQKLSHNIFNHHATEKDFGIFDREEHEDQAPGVQQPLENDAEYPFSGGQGGGGDHYLIQSGEPRSKPHVLVHTINYNDHQ